MSKEYIAGHAISSGGAETAGSKKPTKEKKKNVWKHDRMTEKGVGLSPSQTRKTRQEMAN